MKKIYQAPQLRTRFFVQDVVRTSEAVGNYTYGWFEDWDDNEGGIKQ